MKRLIVAVSFFILLVSGVGCSTQTSSSPNPTTPSANTTGTKKKIGYSVLTLENPFFKVIADTLSSEADKNGYEVIVNDANRDVDAQSKHVDDYIAQKFTAIVLNPVDRIAIGPAVKRANKAGIPVFTCDLKCEDEGAVITGHAGTNNVQGGELAGKAMIEALGEAGGAVLVLHVQQSNSCVERVEGFKKVIEAHNKDRQTGKIEIVAVLEGGGLHEPAYKVTSDALQRHANLAGIFAINDPSALGAHKALEQAGKADQIKIIGFDGQLEGKQAIKDGKLYADPIQFPDQMAVITVQNIMKYVAGESFEKNQLIPTTLYRKADALKDSALK